MQLPEIDPLEFQSLETFIDGLCQILRPPVWHPLSGTGSGVTAFGRNDESFWIRIQRFSDEELVRFRTVSIGGIDEIDAQLDRAPQNFLRVLAIGRPTPDPLARQTHRAEPKPVDQKIPAQQKCFLALTGARRRDKFLQSAG